MPIEIRKMLLLLLLPVFVFGAACQRSADPAPAETGTTTAVSSDSAMVMAHFSSFELPVPTGWPERGNVGKLWEQTPGAGGGASACFLLAGPLEEPADGTASFEQCIARELELFYNTEFDRGAVSFSYDRFSTPDAASDNASLSFVTGDLLNGRTGDTLQFAGGYSEQPAAYFVYAWGPDCATPDVADFAEVTYEGFHAL